MRRNAVREQIGPRALPEKIDNFFTATGETTAGATERFAEGASDESTKGASGESPRVEATNRDFGVEPAESVSSGGYDSGTAGDRSES